MTLRELAEKSTIKTIFVIGEDGDHSQEEWSPDADEKYGHIPLHVIGPRSYESGWHTIQYPQETASFGLVVVTE